MAYTVETDFGTHVDIGTKLQTLLNNATISTLHRSEIIKVGTDRYLAYIVYE